MCYRKLRSPVRKHLDIDEYEKEIKKKKSAQSKITSDEVDTFLEPLMEYFQLGYGGGIKSKGYSEHDVDLVISAKISANDVFEIIKNSELNKELSSRGLGIDLFVKASDGYFVGGRDYRIDNPNDFSKPIQTTEEHVKNYSNRNGLSYLLESSEIHSSYRKLAQVHFREDWKSVYNQADWYFLVYRFNIAGKKELYSIIQKYIRKADETEYSDKELRPLTKEQLQAMFRQYKPSLFGAEPHNL